jgi:3' terminal RNA ribose 2'-O-methyltransferase Hen1
MLLTLTTSHRPATDLGFLLHKNPWRPQRIELSFGAGYIFYPEATEDRCTMALLLDVDPVGMVRGKPGGKATGLRDQYVNDRPYVASSYLSVALAQAFHSAMQGKCKDKPEIASIPIPLAARISVLPCRGGEDLLKRLWEPLGYVVAATRHPLDEKFPEWGDGPYFTVELQRTGTVSEFLTHLYVLIPVLDNEKHYYVGEDEVAKLLEHGQGWLPSHPEREAIAHRYLKRRPSLARLALARIAEEDEPILDGEAGPAEEARPSEEPEPQETLKLNEARIGCVLAALRASSAATVLDLGCGEGKLLQALIKEKQFQRVVGLDVSIRSLEISSRRLHLDEMHERQKGRVELIHGSLMYRDKRLSGFDAAAVVEVIEHLDPERLAAFERVLFEFARPRTVVLTTPNREYNVVWERDREGVPKAGPGDGRPRLRHPDHRFEWSRSEFRAWAEAKARRFGYSVRFLPVGAEEPGIGPATQMAVFALGDAT